MKRITKKQLVANSKLSSNRSLWLQLENLRGEMEWAATKHDVKVPPPLPFVKPKKHYLSILMP